jgi:hypothetical protein
MAANRHDSPDEALHAAALSMFGKFGTFEDRVAVAASPCRRRPLLGTDLTLQCPEDPFGCRAGSCRRYPTNRATRRKYRIGTGPPERFRCPLWCPLPTGIGEIEAERPRRIATSAL